MFPQIHACLSTIKDAKQILKIKSSILVAVHSLHSYYFAGAMRSDCNNIQYIFITNRQNRTYSLDSLPEIFTLNVIIILTLTQCALMYYFNNSECPGYSIYCNISNIILGLELRKLVSPIKNVCRP